MNREETISWTIDLLSIYATAEDETEAVAMVGAICSEGASLDVGATATILGELLWTLERETGRSSQDWVQDLRDRYPRDR